MNISPEIQSSDLIEQIIRTTRMIDLHVDDAFMREQYKTLRRNFIQQLNDVLRDLHLELTELIEED